MSARLVTEQQRLVAGVDVDLAQTGVRLDVHPAGAHELQRPLDVARDLLVAAALRARRHELLGPGVHAVEGGEPALGERPQQVQRRGRLMVGLHEAVGGGDPGRGGGRRVVHAVAAEHGDLVVADQLRECRPGLGELTGDPADLHDRHPHRVHEDDRHLEDHAAASHGCCWRRSPRSSRRSRRPAAGTRCRPRPAPTRLAANAPPRRTPAAEIPRSA